MTIDFYILAIAAILLLTGLLLNNKVSKTSSITLSIFCVGILLVSIFPTNVHVTPPTVQGLIHGFAALIALINLGIAIIARGFVFKKNTNWETLAKIPSLFGAMSMLLLISFLDSPVILKGFTERILLLWDIGWLL